MARGWSDSPGQMWSWGSAQPIWGSVLSLAGSFQLLSTQTGACSSEQVETRELPPLAPWAFTELLCCGSQGFQRSPQLGELEQQISQRSWLPRRRQVATSARRVRTKPLTFSVGHQASVCLDLPFLFVLAGPWTRVSAAVTLASAGSCEGRQLQSGVSWGSPVWPCPTLLGWVMGRQPGTAEEQLSGGLREIRVFVRIQVHC